MSEFLERHYDGIDGAQEWTVRGQDEGSRMTRVCSPAGGRKMAPPSWGWAVGGPQASWRSGGVGDRSGRGSHEQPSWCIKERGL